MHLTTFCPYTHTFSAFWSREVDCFRASTNKLPPVLILLVSACAEFDAFSCCSASSRGGILSLLAQAPMHLSMPMHWPTHVPQGSLSHFVSDVSPYPIADVAMARLSPGRCLCRHMCVCAFTSKLWQSAIGSSASDNFLSIYTYLLGLLAMIKCSICSYQCDS